MKKIFYTLLAAATLAGCAKDASLDNIGESDNAVEFSVEMLTRAFDLDDLKNEWEEGNKIAVIDITDRANPEIKCYEIASDESSLVLSSGETEGFYNKTGEEKYIAFYPYDSGYEYSDYTALASSSFSEVDVLSSAETGASLGSVSFTFTHAFACLTFEFLAGTEYTDNLTQLNATLTIGSEAQALEVTQDVAGSIAMSILVKPQGETDFSTLAKTLVLYVNDESSISYTVDLETTSVVSWMAGKKYTYNNIYIGTMPLE